MFVPTGGITAENLASYLRLPMVFACGGSWLVAPNLIADGAYKEVTRLARESVHTVERERTPGASR
jgi:2-dehydro-3-deoxyphosphogluconate aldolase/(4S)-4-hydroxy-2-oxoglutarate aldolase